MRKFYSLYIKQSDQVELLVNEEAKNLHLKIGNKIFSKAEGFNKKTDKIEYE